MSIVKDFQLVNDNTFKRNLKLILHVHHKIDCKRNSSIYTNVPLYEYVFSISITNNKSEIEKTITIMFVIAR